MNRRWKMMATIYVAFTLPLALTGFHFIYYFVWQHHMFIMGW